MAKGERYSGLHSEIPFEKAGLVYLFLKTDKGIYSYKEITNVVNELFNYQNPRVTTEHIESFVQAISLQNLTFMDFIPSSLERKLLELRGENGKPVS